MVGIYANTDKPNAVSIANELRRTLSDRGVANIFLERGFSQCPDLIVVVGGDGTVLEVVQKAAETGVPILAVNAGNVGFLTEFEAEDFDTCVEIICGEDYDCYDRKMLSCSIVEEEFYAFNEVSIHRMNTENDVKCTLSVSLKIDGEFVESFRSDGLIIATPAGSTAYSLSAGGAILAPDLKALIATPLCAHTLTSKPIVFSEDSIAEITVSGSVKGGVFCDGKFKTSLSDKDVLTVKTSDLKAKFIKGKRTFYDTLFKKLTSWGVNR